jgi:Na+-driven multidrug efflux pump
MHVLLGHNFGAQRIDRVKAFMRIAAISIATLSIMLVIILHVFESSIVGFFLEDDAKEAQQLAQSFLQIIWPIFLFNGFNVLICAYLTSAEQAIHSSIIAMLRSLILPISFALLLSLMLPGIDFLYAVPVAEALAFVFALIFFINYRPALLIRKSLG